MEERKAVSSGTEEMRVGVEVELAIFTQRGLGESKRRNLGLASMKCRNHRQKEVTKVIGGGDASIP